MSTETIGKESSARQIAKALKEEHKILKRRSRGKEEKEPTKIEKFDETMDITAPMQMVKDCYHLLTKNDPELTLEKAAVYCEVRPSYVEEWLKDPDVKLWFETTPLGAKTSMMVLTLTAIREARMLLTHNSSYVREGMAKFLINHGAGKPIDKNANDPLSDDGPEIEEDFDELTELEKKLKILENKREFIKEEKNVNKRRVTGKTGKKAKRARRKRVTTKLV